MDKTLEIMKDIDSILNQDSEVAEGNVTILQNTQQVIDNIEIELSTKEGAQKEKIDSSHNFGETIVLQKVANSSVCIAENSNLQHISVQNSESEQKMLSESSIFENVRKNQQTEILDVQQTVALRELHHVQGNDSENVDSPNISLSSCRNELTEVLSASVHNDSRENKSVSKDDEHAIQTDTFSESGGINTSGSSQALCVDNLQGEIEPPLKRLKTIDTVEKKYADTQKECEKKQSPSKRDIFYTASAVIQKDIPLQTQGRKTEERIDEGEIRHSVYNFQGAPHQLTGAWGCFMSESCNNYLRGCKWAPDGTCLMTNSNDNCIRVFNTPEQLYSAGQDRKEIEELMPVLKMKEADIIYDYCWYSKMRSCDPDSACLAVTSKETPVHMFDAFTGDLRCSYRAFNQVDQLVAAYCVSFDLSGEKLYCGFNKMIRVFDVNRPGRDCVSRPTYAKEGQSGIISCIAHSPTEIGLYAAGSYSRSIALYSEPQGEMICMFDGQQGGVTHIMFSPDGSKLYSGGRKDNEILCWDLRNPGQILYTLERKVSTNQRIYFDITPDGRYFVSGSHDGQVRVWDTLQTPVQIENCQEPILPPIMSFQGHSDTLNGVSLNPYLPVVATSSGQRHFPSFDDSSDENTDTEEQIKIDNSLRLWWIT